MLANNWVFHTPAVQRPLRSARTWVRRKRREALAWLGFPENESAVRNLARVTTRSCEIPVLLMLRSLLADREAAKLLCHVPRINADVLRMLHITELRQRITAPLLAEVGQNQTGDRRARYAYCLRDTHLMLNLSGNRRGWKAQSIEHLMQTHDEVAADLLVGRRSGLSLEYQFPHPPIPKIESEQLSLHPLTKPDDLVKEGAAMEHCIGSSPFYMKECAAGRLYVYRGTVPERFTVCITREGIEGLQSRWEINQLTGRRNRKVKNLIWRSVQAWLNHHQPAQAILRS
jgi:hypothetical protein